jgi:glycosyltransferase involved in cell wall biosynthesis
MIFEATGPFNAIGRIAMAEVEAALEAGCRVSVLANRLAESLQGRVEWLKLYNPPRGFALKWLTARHFIKKAMGDPSRFDLIHGHQPQIADLCDLFECHYLTRAAMERGCLDARTGLRGRVARVQERIVLRAEDRCYRRWNPTTELVCDSELTLREFGRLYGLPPRHGVQIYPAPQWNPPTAEEKAAARRELVGDWSGPVVGFLGGMNERKGFQSVIDAASRDKNLFVLAGGSHSEMIEPGNQLRPRFRAVGLVEDVDRFYAAIDVLLVPSVFEPFGLVCFEAAARSVPVIASENVGALATMEPYDVVRRWDTHGLQCQVDQLLRNPQKIRSNCKALVDTFSVESFNRRLIQRYDDILRKKRETGLNRDTDPAAATLHSDGTAI